MGDSNQVKGELSTSYASMTDDQIARVSHLLPHAKLIYILRNPIDRAWSRLVMGIIRNQGRQVSDLSLEEMRHYLSRNDVVRNGQYLINLQNGWRYFDKKQLLILYYQNVKRRPKYLLTRVFRHLGVDPKLVDLNQLPLQQPVMVNPKVPMPPEIRRWLLKQYRPRINRWYQVLKNPIILDWLSEN